MMMHEAEDVCVCEGQTMIMLGSDNNLSFVSNVSAFRGDKERLIASQAAGVCRVRVISHSVSFLSLSRDEST